MKTADVEDETAASKDIQARTVAATEETESMSALGGSMFPRFLMSETMQRFGLLTFNAWALDGYLKVFWRQAAIWELWPQVLVLVMLAAVFLTTARLIARRWETA